MRRYTNIRKINGILAHARTVESAGNEAIQQHASLNIGMNNLSVILSVSTLGEFLNCDYKIIQLRSQKLLLRVKRLFIVPQHPC